MKDVNELKKCELWWTVHLFSAKIEKLFFLFFLKGGNFALFQAIALETLAILIDIPIQGQRFSSEQAEQGETKYAKGHERNGKVKSRKVSKFR